MSTSRRSARMRSISFRGTYDTRSQYPQLCIDIYCRRVMNLDKEVCWDAVPVY